MKREQLSLSQDIARDMAQQLISNAIAADNLNEIGALYEGMPPNAIVDIDMKTFSIALRVMLENDVLSAVYGISLWLLQSCYTAGCYDEIALVSACDDLAKKKICANYDIRTDLFERVIAALVTKEQLPGVGKINDGVLVPDKTSIEQWASQFKWVK